MKPELIVMLTQNDITVGNAKAVFEACEDLPIRFWGFKNVGISPQETLELVNYMKASGKITFLEVVTYTEESCLENAKLAVEYGFDYLTGTLFYPSVLAYLKGKPIKYFPFVGDVGGSPVTLKGSLPDIANECRRLEQAGVDGLDLVAYRYVDGDPVELAKLVVSSASKPVILAGSISSEERIHVVKDINPYGFTMGSALFESRFVANASFRANLEAVLAIMNSI